MLYQIIIHFNNDLYVVIDLGDNTTGDQHYFDRKKNNYKYQFKLKNAYSNLQKHNNKSKHLSRKMFTIKITEE